MLDKLGHRPAKRLDSLYGRVWPELGEGQKPRTTGVAMLNARR